MAARAAAPTTLEMAATATALPLSGSAAPRRPARGASRGPAPEARGPAPEARGPAPEARGPAPEPRRHDAGLAELAGSVAWTLIGCCCNAVILEAMIKEAPDVTHLIALSQYAFMTALGAPRHVQWPRPAGEPWRWVPRLVHTVPLHRWIGVVVLFFITSLLTNTAFRYHISMPVQIVLRSASLCVSMLYGVVYFGRRYSLSQVVAVLCVTAGIVLVTISTVRNKADAEPTQPDEPEAEGFELEKLIGLGMLMISMLLAGLLGAIQEEVFRVHGRLSDEAAFYSHFLGLPAFLFFWNDLARSVVRCNECGSWPILDGGPASVWPGVPVPKMWVLMVLNVVTQFACLRGVYGMAARTSNLTVNVALSVRKALSLLISIVYFGNPFTTGHMIGAVLVFGGTLLYRDTPSSAAPAKAKAA